jgi:hypothetical protein
LDEIEDSTVLGYANGYSDVKPEEFSKLRKWRGRKLHLLGGSPSTQYDLIQQLTQPTLDNTDPADIVGLDGNAVFKAAFYGEYWSPEKWKRADHLSIRETVEKSLEEMKRFWQQVGVWPEQTPRQRCGPAVIEPDDHVWLDHPGDPIPDRGGLERSYIAEYSELGTVAYESEAYKRFVKHRDGLGQV